METEVKTSVGDVLPSQFKFYYDAFHGWLEVPYSAILALNLDKQISNDSFQTEESVYLEEGLDAPLFIRAYLREIGKQGNQYAFNTLCSTIYEGAISKIRSLTPYKSKPSL